ncbi:hypothetical protein MPL1_00782 [Methylophaga lonarensis MPL]|uniref:Proline rich signal peptide protein n=2 Tax=Methylophaga lonarensis TaxID=999151 RepID=M7NZG2_9GAMM|nr:DUF4390 domain-containing protein [Methylophaga lonarensis]EMR14218.1 hypothetical protein MPL1_00782 [Methylophaga lonarensis MPL]
MHVFSVVKLTRKLLLMLALCWSVPAVAETFRVEHADVRKVGNGHILNASISYPLTPRVLEALEHGVPITFFQEIQLINEIPVLGPLWQWNRKVWRTELVYELRFHQLSRQYVLTAVSTQKFQTFPTIEEALASMGRINALTLPPEILLKHNRLQLRLRSGLDLHALPTPMRPGALLSTKWQLTSPWTEAKWY